MKSAATANRCVFQLLDLPKYGHGIGLRRMRALCSALFGNGWGATVDAIKVTGSNGKGSVCAMTDSILRALGLSCGLYTSPHLWRFHERIVSNGVPISDPDLAEAVAWYAAHSADVLRQHPTDRFGSFEAITAVALFHFRRHQPEALVLEAGIGGRYDPTRIVPGTLAALTSLDLEHTEVLGDSLELIAYDKADLCPEGGTLVVGAIDPDVFDRLAAYCSLRGVRVISAPDVCKLTRVGSADSGMLVDLELEGRSWQRVPLALEGVHQLSNAAVAAVLSREWLQKHRPQLAAEAFFAGLLQGWGSVHWPGRFQKIDGAPELYIDVGHSPDAIRCLVASVRRRLPDRSILLVTGVSRNKRVEEIVAQLVEIADLVICTRAYHYGSEVPVIAAIARKHRPDLEIHEARTIEQAMTLARALAVERGLTILVAGGLFLSIEAERAWKGLDPQALRFF